MALSVADVDYLREADLTELTDKAQLTKKSALADAQLAHQLHGDFGRAALELIAARASEKIPSTWFGDSDSVQQATPAPVVAERARRLQGLRVHDVTCSIGAEGAAHQGEWIGSDLDPARLAMAQLNLPGRLLLRADALRPVSRDTVVVADPARRSGGRRIKDTIPPLPDLMAAWAGHEMAIKCAPGIDYSEFDGLVSVSSVAGSVKETCLYTAGFSSGERREAVIHHAEGIDRVTDLEPDDVEVAKPGRFIIDPDGAIVRAGLVRQFAHREGLWMLDERIAHLTGDRIPQGYSGFEVIEQVGVKQLKQALAALDAASVEILVRGVDVDPDALRQKLKLRGSRPLAVVITRIGRSATAMVCNPRQWAEGPLE
ncbi:THUMP-like domain-containing protein [Corynebacterium tapiri]|uniref:SAM-dependent methyltransferase n=1 Tax=Corynebacterium tapiri TaxID=1448266 RepID=A0A5C4U6M1_9CORY|nr:SAM-dependent methyltransferase [Corynebacterium tapiri]TNL99752.1 SAM-dependent methyltransferase [Corynebacterium tapiri]